MVATNKDSGHRSLTAPGVGADEAVRVAMHVLAEEAGLSVHEVAPGRISVARTRRPGWAVALCVATVWLAGLGLLFLLVRRTESGELVVTDGPRGSLLVVPPLVSVTALRTIEEALRSTLPLPAAVGADLLARPDGGAAVDGDVDVDDLDGRTVARVDRPSTAAASAPPTAPVAAGAGPPAAPTSVVAVALCFADGVLEVEAGRPVVLGRDPSATAVAEARVVPGDASTVSKSHLLVTFDGAAVTVEDLGSTNGSWVHRAGSPEPLRPGVAASVASGEQVVMGSVAFTVEHGARG